MKQKLSMTVTIWVGSIGAFMLGSLALAQVGRSGGGPIEVAAQDLSFDPGNGVTLLTGNASVVQDGAVLRAPRIRVTYLRGASGATGNVDKVTTEG